MTLEDSTATLQEQAVREMLNEFDAALATFVRLTMPQGTQYVMVLGGDNKSGAVISNVLDREVTIEFLTVALTKLRQ